MAKIKLIKYKVSPVSKCTGATEWKNVPEVEVEIECADKEFIKIWEELKKNGFVTNN